MINEMKSETFPSQALGLPYSMPHTKILIQCAWAIAYAALWSNCAFSSEELKSARRFIHQFLTEGEDSYSAYMCFCQRILLVREYVQRNANRFVPLPTYWFDADNSNGFAGTEGWYKSMLQTRRSLPLYRMELKALAEAVLEMKEDASRNNFQYWTGYFRERGCVELSQLFLSAVLQGQYDDY